MMKGVKPVRRFYLDLIRPMVGRLRDTGPEHLGSAPVLEAHEA